MTVTEPDRTIRIDEELLHDSNVSREAFGSEAHGQAVDVGF